MQAVKFKGKWKQGRLTFVGKETGDGTVVGPVYGFEDPDAAPFFLATGFAVATDEEPDIVVTKDELDLDPATTWAPGTPASIGIAGQKVLGGNPGVNLDGGAD